MKKSSLTWWWALVEKIAAKADNFEIRYWADEGEAIATGERFGKQLENHEITELVFQGAVTKNY